MPTLLKIIPWTALPTSKAGSGFYPTTKWIGQAYRDGRIVAETGKCATKEGAAAALRRKLGLSPATKDRFTKGRVNA